jgi:hypothetical protein
MLRSGPGTLSPFAALQRFGLLSEVYCCVEVVDKRTLDQIRTRWVAE